MPSILEIILPVPLGESVMFWLPLPAASVRLVAAGAVREDAPAISPVVSAIVTTEFWMSLPVVPSNRATALSVAEAGPSTSPMRSEEAEGPFPPRQFG
ncbi:MAG: hypothetical protein JW395_2949 [Nitrospira sp.]|nr:hypothetical protein [Nitrospira sp.]